MENIDKKNFYENKEKKKANFRSITINIWWDNVTFTWDGKVRQEELDALNKIFTLKDEEKKKIFNGSLWDLNNFIEILAADLAARQNNPKYRNEASNKEVTQKITELIKILNQKRTEPKYAEKQEEVNYRILFWSVWVNGVYVENVMKIDKLLEKSNSGITFKKLLVDLRKLIKWGPLSSSIHSIVNAKFDIISKKNKELLLFSIPEDITSEDIQKIIKEANFSYISDKLVPLKNIYNKIINQGGNITPEFYKEVFWEEKYEKAKKEYDISSPYSHTTLEIYLRWLTNQNKLVIDRFLSSGINNESWEFNAKVPLNDEILKLNKTM